MWLRIEGFLRFDNLDRGLRPRTVTFWKATSAERQQSIRHNVIRGRAVPLDQNAAQNRSLG